MTREEAIKIIQSATVWTDEERTALGLLIPELRESEDERIRKELIQFLRDYPTNLPNGKYSRSDFFAWLEKQKEHRETCTKFLAKILKHSAEGFRNVLKKKGIDYIPSESFWTGAAGTFSKQECNEFYKWMDDMTMELVTEETPEYKKGFKDGLDASKKEQKPWRVGENAYFTPEQKPVEPSDEELQRHQDELTEFKKFATKQAKENQLHISYTRDVMWENFCSELLSFVNSRKPKQEWSDEDEKMRCNILNALTPNLVYSCGKGTSTGTSMYKYDKEIKWLKSLRRQWRPSEEQGLAQR